MTAADPKYARLLGILFAAYEQAASGKGAERHGTGEPWEQQTWRRVVELTGPDFVLGQAVKKITESRRLPADARKRELLGAIVYVAMAAQLLDEESGTFDATIAATPHRVARHFESEP